MGRIPGLRKIFWHTVIKSSKIYFDTGTIMEESRAEPALRSVADRDA